MFFNFYTPTLPFKKSCLAFSQLISLRRDLLPPWLQRGNFWACWSNHGSRRRCSNAKWRQDGHGILMDFCFLEVFWRDEPWTVGNSLEEHRFQNAKPSRVKKHLLVVRGIESIEIKLHPISLVSSKLLVRSWLYKSWLSKSFLNLINGTRWGEVEQPLGSVVFKWGEQSQSDWLLAGTNGFDGSNHDMMFFNEGERSCKMHV